MHAYPTVTRTICAVPTVKEHWSMLAVFVQRPYVGALEVWEIHQVEMLGDWAILHSQRHPNEHQLVIHIHTAGATKGTNTSHALEQIVPSGWMDGCFIVGGLSLSVWLCATPSCNTSSVLVTIG
jgi:hypothetical protein